MKVTAVFALCFFGLVLFSFGQFINQSPAISVTINALNSTNFPVSGVIGQENTTNDIDLGSTANTIYSPGKLVFVPFNNYTQNFSSILQLTPGTTGLLAVDTYGDRVMYFPNVTTSNTPLPNATQITATFAIGQANTTNVDDEFLDSIISVDYNRQGVYVLANEVVYFYSWSSIQAYYSSGGIVNPDTYFGNCSTCTYQALSNDVYDIAVKKSTGEIFVADYGCYRILVFPANAGPTIEPSYVIGLNDTTQCGYGCSNAHSPSTCLTGHPYLMTFDSQDNLWVSTYSDTGLFFFPNATKQLTSTFVAYANDDNERSYYDASQISMGPTGDNQILMATEWQQLVIQFTFALGNPISASNVLDFGYASDTSGSSGVSGSLSYTNSLEDITGGAVLRTPSGVGNAIFVSDSDNHRIVSFVLNSTIVGNSVSPTISTTPSQGSSQTASRTATNTPASQTRTVTATMSPTATNTPGTQSPSNTFGASTTNTPSATSTPSTTPTPSLTPSQGSNPSPIQQTSSSHNSGASSVASWLSLIL